jgi:hypothetical protein
VEEHKQNAPNRGRGGRGGRGRDNRDEEKKERDPEQEAKYQARKEQQRLEREERQAKRAAREEAAKAEEEKKNEPVVEEEEEGFTLDDYFAAKNAKSQGLLKKSEGRQHEKMEMKQLKGHEKDGSQFEQTKIYRKADTAATRANEGANLLGFQATVDQGDLFDAKRGGRGGRGGRDQAPRDNRQGGNNNRRRGGKIVVDDNEFPTL